MAAPSARSPQEILMGGALSVEDIFEGLNRQMVALNKVYNTQGIKSKADLAPVAAILLDLATLGHASDPRYEKAFAQKWRLEKELQRSETIKREFGGDSKDQESSGSRRKQPRFRSGGPSSLPILLALSGLAWALQGGVHAPIMDCDETFNYLEPLHYVTRGTGMQTWEYSPAFRLRSWLYVEAHSPPIRLLNWLAPQSPFLGLVALRVFLHVFSVLAESRLCDAVNEKFGNGSGVLCAVLLGFSPGMSHARRAMLPSSTCMLGYTLALAYWMRGDAPVRCLVAGSMAVIFAWPYSAPAFIPMGLHILATKGLRPVIVAALLGLLLFGATSVAVDSWYYSRTTWPLLEQIIYNAFGGSGGGAHLYGVESWTFYPKNLVLNFNVAFVLCMVPDVFNRALVLYNTLPMASVIALFMALAHKEERFLSVIYPSICVGAAVVLATRFPFRLRVVALGVFVVLSLARHVALGRLAAPSEVLQGVAFRQGATVCLGREWHRFPSSFVLPDGVKLAWTQSDFKGQLPLPFREWPQGLSVTPLHMNDMNRFEPATLTDPAKCDYYIDSLEPTSPNDALVMGGPSWQAVRCRPFCDAARSKQPYRSFAVPWDAYKGVEVVEYCLWARK